MLRWALIEGIENSGIVEESLTVYASGRAAIEDADSTWNHTWQSDLDKTVTFYVGLFNVDENGDFYEDEDGNIDGDCRVVLKDWVNEEPEQNRFKRILKASGMTGKEFSRQYGVPYKSLRHWIDGDREAPDYVLDMLEQSVWMEKENR